MVLPFLSDSCAKCCYANKPKMLDIYQAYPMFNLVPANFKVWDNNQSYKLQHMLGSNFSLTTKKANVDFLNFKNRRLGAKSCSDSSMEGRSSDSTYTSSSGGNGDGNTTAADESFEGNNSGITGRFTRQAINSRFPSMDSNLAYMRLHKPAMNQPGMGAYAHLQQQQYNINSPYGKINYGLPYYQRRKLHPSQQQLPPSFQQQQQHQQESRKRNSLAQESFKKIENHHKQQSNIHPGNSDGPDNSKDNRTSTVLTKVNQTNNEANSTARRFVNVEKFMQPSVKSPPANNSQGLIPEHLQTTPISVKSATYSQKSTASARSSGTFESGNINNEKDNMQNEGIVNEISSSDEKCNIAIEQQNNDSQADLIQENLQPSPKETIEPCLKQRSPSITSVQSRKESIKTPPAMSPSSLVIEEVIKGVDSLSIVDQQLPKNTSNGVGDSPKAGNGNITPNRDEFEDGDGEIQTKIVFKPSNTPSGKRSPTIDEIKVLSRRGSLVKSMECLYDRAPPTKTTTATTTNQYSFDTATESSSPSSNQTIKTVNTSLTSLPAKPQHTPLKQKSKTACSLRAHRRVSPVKQSIKTTTQQSELYPSTLQGFDKPREALHQTFNRLDSTNWEIIMQGLKLMVRLMRYHPETLDTQMHMVCSQLTRLVRNLRSQVARAACQAATEFFEIKSKTLEQECDDLVCALILRTADTNRFLRADAARALESMCNNLSPLKILNILTTKGAVHQHSLVRTTTAKLLNGLVVRLGYEKVYEMSRDNRDKFFLTGANLLLDGSLETRGYAKSLFRLLSDHPSYNRLLLEVIPTRIFRNIEKTLKSIR